MPYMLYMVNKFPDPAKRPLSQTDPRTGTATTAYYTSGTGKTGQIHTQTDAANNTTTYDYSTTTGRLAWAQNALNKKAYYAYNARGQVTNTWGDTGYPIEKVYDSLGQMTALKTYRGGTGWTDSSWPTATTGDADTSTWTYDASSGLATAKTFADSNSVSYTYTSDGKLLTRTWARSDSGNPLVTTYSYDSNTGQQTGIDYSDSTQDIAFSYTRTGQQYQVTDAVGTRTFAYNAALQPATETISGLYGKTIARDYATTGMIGRYTSMNIGTEYDVDYGYDAYGRMNTITSGDDAFTYGYLANSNLAESLSLSIASVPSIKSTNTYESHRNLITRVKNEELVDPSSTVSQYDYVNDAIGRRTSKSRTGTAFTTADSITLGYNDRSEVTSAVSNNIAAYNYAFAFDNIGNRSSSTVAGTSTAYTADNLNQYTAITQGSTINPTYDNDGGMLTLPQISGGTWNNTWNCENRLIETYNDTVGKKLEFVYDYMGRRVEKKVYTGTSGTSWTLSAHERFVYDGYKLIEKLDGANTNAILQKFLWQPEALGADVPLSVYDAGASTTYYYFTDANKNIGQLMDASGNAVAKYEYSPFGKQTVCSGNYATTNPFCFSSEYFDSETGLVYYNYRYYSPQLGRWLSRDPIAEEGGWNLYGMVGNNPIDNWDVNGYGIIKFVKECFRGKKQVDKAKKAQKTKDNQDKLEDTNSSPKEKTEAAFDQAEEAARHKAEKDFVDINKKPTAEKMGDAADKVNKRNDAVANVDAYLDGLDKKNKK